jgi:hypothetical protein
MKTFERIGKGEIGVVAALTGERYLRRSLRAQWSRDRVSFQIDELNALGAQLLPRLAPQERARRLVRARSRAAAIRLAATWTPQDTAAAVHAYLSAGAVVPEDLLGPALLLEAVEPNDPRTRELLATLAPPVSRIVAQLSGAVAAPHQKANAHG